jgi:hypothetical protein
MSSWKRRSRKSGSSRTLCTSTPLAVLRKRLRWNVKSRSNAAHEVDARRPCDPIAQGPATGEKGLLPLLLLTHGCSSRDPPEGGSPICEWDERRATHGPARAPIRGPGYRHTNAPYVMTIWTSLRTLCETNPIRGALRLASADRDDCRQAARTTVT